jgi:RNA polymerase sigma factor (sigma-70 family)
LSGSPIFIGEYMRPIRSIAERNALVAAHLQLAKILAGKRHRTVSSTVQYGELLSAAYQGLINAAELYNEQKAHPEAQKPFQCYASRRIVGEMYDYLRACNWGSRAKPQNMISTEAVAYCNLSDDRSMSIEDTLASRDRSSVDQLNGVELFEKIIRCLPARDKQVFRLRYLYDLTMKEVASCVALSESRISQILTHSIAHLRRVWVNRIDELCEEVGAEH